MFTIAGGILIAVAVMWVIHEIMAISAHQGPRKWLKLRQVYQDDTLAVFAGTFVIALIVMLVVIV